MMPPVAISKSAGVTPRPWRTAARCGVLIAAVAFAWPWGVGSSFTPLVLPALSPFVATGSALAARTISIVTLLALPVLLLALWFPRCFCSYACPTGFLQEMVERFRPWPPKHLPKRVPELGRWIVAITVGGACLGYPLWMWLDPLALFNGFLNCWRQPLATAGWLTGLGLPLLLLVAFAVPRVWCQRLCPLGATQELLAWPKRRLCQKMPCQPASIQQPGGPRLGRRLFIGGCAGAASVLLLNKTRATTRPPLRPPGALGETRFTAVCIRCGNCAQACPSRVIQPDFGASGLAGWLTPRLRFDDDYCRADCHRCGQVCPSGAIARLSLAEKRRRIIGPARLELDLCLLYQGRECTACLKQCPYDALAMHTADGGFSNEPCVDLAKCTGCGACEVVCPVRPQRAIRVLPRVPDTPMNPAPPNYGNGSSTRSAFPLSVS